MKKKLIAATILTILATNISFAEIVDFSGTESSSSKETVDKNTQMNILQNNAGSITTGSSEAIFPSVPGGSDTGPVTQYSVAVGYLTPMKDFGWEYLLNPFSVSNVNGKVNVAVDTYGKKSSSNYKLGSSISNKSSATIYQLLNDVNKYYLYKSSGGNGVFLDIMNNLDVKDIPKMHIQTADDGRKFVSASVLVRWTSDFDSGTVWTYNPVLKGVTTHKNGPYVAVGDFMDSNDAVTKSVVRKKPDKYLKPLSEIVSGVNFSSIPFLGTDENLLKDTSSSTKTAVVSKTSEWRRYIEVNGNHDSTLGEYEYVYPVEEVTVKSKKEVATKGLENSIKSETVFKDKAKTEVEKYLFHIKSKPQKAAKAYQEDENGSHKYTFSLKTGSEEIDNTAKFEPGENKVDRWHDIVSRTLYIKDHTGKTILKKPLDSSSGDSFTVEVLPSEIGGKPLIGCNAYLETEYYTNTRYMSRKETVLNKYVMNGASGDKLSYEEVMLYIKDKTDKNSSLAISTAKLTKYEDSTNPRLEKTFTTVKSTKQKSSVQSTIEAAQGGDPSNVDASVSVNPPNALTKLEGGSFDVIMELNKIDLPVDDPTKSIWISDRVITSLIITAQNGEIIYEHPEPIKDFGADGQEFKIKGLTANPSHIGKATLTATYEYVLNYKTTDSSESAGGSSEETEGVKTQSHKKTLTGHFDIYSLSGVTE